MCCDMLCVFRAAASGVSEARLGSCDLHEGGGAILASLCDLDSSALHCSYHLSSEGGALGLIHTHAVLFLDTK